MLEYPARWPLASFCPLSMVESQARHPGRPAAFCAVSRQNASRYANNPRPQLRPACRPILKNTTTAPSNAPLAGNTSNHCNAKERECQSSVGHIMNTQPRMSRRAQGYGGRDATPPLHTSSCITRFWGCRSLANGGCRTRLSSRILCEANLAGAGGANWHATPHQ